MEQQHDCYGNYLNYCYCDSDDRRHYHLISCQAGRNDVALESDRVAIAHLYDLLHGCNSNYCCCFAVAAFRCNIAEDVDYHYSADHDVDVVAVDDIAAAGLDDNYLYHHVYKIDGHDHIHADHSNYYFRRPQQHHYSKKRILHSGFYCHNYFVNPLLFYCRRHRRDSVVRCHLRAANGDFAIFLT